MNRSPLLVFSLFLAVTGQTLAEKFDNIALSVGGQYSRRLSGAPRHNNAIGGTLAFEWLPSPQLSIGLGTDLNCYWGVATGTAEPSFSSSIDLRGRFLPWGISQDKSPFLIVGAGFNPKIGQNAWPGSFHALAGVGTWISLSPKLALDLAATYDLYTAPSSSLQTVNLRAGLSFFSVELPAAKTQAAPSPQPTQELAAPTPAPTPAKKKKARKVQANSFWDLAARPDVYGDPELYPLLVDANFEKLTTPGTIGSIPLVKGAKLTVPRALTEENTRVARQNAWKPTYTRWRGKAVTPEDYRQWKIANPKGATQP